VIDLREQLARAAWNALPATPHGWEAADGHTRELWLNVVDGQLPVVLDYAADQLDAAADRTADEGHRVWLHGLAAALRQQEPTGFCVCDPGEPRRDCGIPEHRDRAAALRNRT
jgi:hypothetical protein